MRQGAFSGRVIFDRMPKTGGHAIARWLRQELGTGVVTDNVIGGHRDLIRRFGGLYSVISAHVQFGGEGLDPRYHYVTCLRDPVDRAVSWLYFMLSNHRPEDLEPGLWQAVRRFVDSEGALCDDQVAACIGNYYVRHFAGAIAARPGRDLLADALAALAHYEICGFYEALPDLVGDLAKFLQIPAPPLLAPDNVTRARPRLSDIPSSLRQRLTELNDLDLELYRRQQERHAVGLGRPGGLSAPPQPVWIPLPEPLSRVVRTDHLTLLAAGADSQGRPVDHGAPVVFTLEFDLHRPVAELLVGIHIIDQDHRWAFGTNSRILGKPMRRLSAGRYRARFQVVAGLPEGSYQAGFAFVEAGAGGETELGWYDRQVAFAVQVHRLPGSGGYIGLDTGFACTPLRQGGGVNGRFSQTQ